MNNNDAAAAARTNIYNHTNALKNGPRDVNTDGTIYALSNVNVTTTGPRTIRATIYPDTYARPHAANAINSILTGIPGTITTIDEYTAELTW